ncbi:hypothetical protein LCGC14_0662200 [marine sediment metagenome]|uniref:Uncharacterized protein n=1 Tax=marine sediment metagenome TaxID=412755 RepID=A0A0F9QYC2_9ZZZZ
MKGDYNQVIEFIKRILECTDEIYLDYYSRMSFLTEYKFFSFF